MKFQMIPRNLRQKWNIAYRVLIALAVIIGVFTLSFEMTKWLSSWLDWHPGAYLTQLTTLGLTIILLIVGGTIVSHFVSPRQQAIWQSLFEALRNMAKGNFDVHLDVGMIREPGGEEHPFRVLLHSINDMAQELAQLERMRQEFISNVSHEIQSPLTSIQGFATALRRSDLSLEQQDRYLEIIEDESKRMSRLSDNLLKLTSLESGYHPFHPDTYRLDRQIRDTVLASEPTWLDKNLQVVVNMPAIELVADKDLLSQVWVNILSNAIKFSSQQGSITIDAKVSDEWVNVRIQDTGIGMAHEEIERVFERFYKVDKARSNRVLGSGLGLSIVKKIVDLHSGTVRVESSLGHGSAFIVSLPLQPLLTRQPPH